MGETPDIFKNPKKVVNFVGGPNDKDSVRLLDDVRIVVVPDPDDAEVRHTYLRTDEETLSYQGVNPQVQEETND